MLETSSNLRINLCLFELAIFGTPSDSRWSHRTLPESVFAVFWPILGKAIYWRSRHFSIFECQSYFRQDSPGTIVKRISWFWWTLWSGNESRNLVLLLSLGGAWCVWLCWVLLECPRFAAEMFPCPRLQRYLSNICAINLRFYFDPSKDKYEWRATNGGYGGPHHGRLLKSGGQIKMHFFSWPLWKVNNDLVTNCCIKNGYS